MRSGVLVLGLISTASCGVEIGGERARSANPDAAATAPDASDAPPPPVDAPDGPPAYLAACMAKGYAAVGALTSLYRTAGASRTWLDAAAECAADVPGATHLVVLSSTAEVTYIKDRRGWVGLSDRATEGVFVNVTNEPNDLRPFLSGQPDNGSGSEDCVQMKADGLDDDQCDNTHGFVCECDGRAPI